MKTKRKVQKQWLDSRGRMLPTEQLKEISKTWDKKTWNQFLDSSNGSIEGLQLISARRLAHKAKYMTNTVFDLWAERSEPENVQKNVQKSLSILTDQQRRVVEAVFFDGYSMEAAAAKLNLSKPTVFVYLKNALNKLRASNAVSTNDLTNMRGQEDFNGDASNGINSEVYEVFLAESQRYDMRKSNFNNED